MKNFIKFTCGTAVAVLAVAQAHATLLVNEPFSEYTNGDLVANSVNNTGVQPAPGPWTGYSGSTPLNVVNGQAIDNMTNSQDDAIVIPNGPYTNNTPGGPILYASFNATWSVLPTGTTTYFAMFKDTSTSDFTSRIYTTNTVGGFQLGILNGATAANIALVPQTLTLGTTYQIVMEMNDSSGLPISTLWINPTSPAGGTTATDTGFNDAYTQFALRQNTTALGSGVIAIDSLLIGTTFSDVVIPEPSTVALVGMGLVGILAIRRRRRS